MRKEKKAGLAKATLDVEGATEDEAEPPSKIRQKHHADVQAESVVAETAPAPASNRVPDAPEAEQKTFTAFIGGLPSHVDEDFIKTDFAECGRITKIVLSRWPEDGTSKGLAFVTFATESALNRCLEWNGEYYFNKVLRVERKEGKDNAQRRDMGKGGQRGHKPLGCMAVAVLDMTTEVTEDDLWSYFEPCGTISAVKILKHRETYESRGIAFVTFEDTGATDKAVQRSGKKLAGKVIRVEYAAPKNDAGAKGKTKGKGKGACQEKPEGCMSVVVNNLSTDASEDDVWDLFKDCSSATNVTILFDRETQLSKGMAFVDFDDTNDTDIAVKLSGKEVCGKAVSVRFKVPK